MIQFWSLQTMIQLKKIWMTKRNIAIRISKRNVPMHGDTNYICRYSCYVFWDPMFFWYCSFDVRINATAMYSVPLLFSKHFWVQITLYGHSADSWPQTKSLFLFLTQEKNIFLNTNADSVIQGNHTRSNNSILLNTILLTCHSSHDVVRHGMPVALWSSTLLPALILLDKATSILHTRHVHLPFVRACHLYSNHPIYKS